MYKVEWDKKAEKDLAKIDRTMAMKIKFGVEHELTKNPHTKGKPLKGKWKGRWSFRFSEYRIIYEIKEEKILILVVKVGHRREVY